MSTLTALQVSEIILANKGDKIITHRKLQKLLYYCQAVSLAQNNEPLFEDKIEAWEFGPVCSKVYHRYKQYGYESLPRKVIDENNYSKKAINIILGVIATFGVLSQEQLIEISHIDEPWAKEYIPSLNKELKPELIKNYFSNFEGMEDYKQYISKRHAYNILIESRKSYLQSLDNLGDNWMSSKSIAPSIESIRLGSKILAESKDILNKNSKFSIPKLIIGPIASGGIGIEFVNNEKNKLFIDIYNDLTLELSTEKDGRFDDIESDYDEGFNSYKNYFKELVA